MMQKFKQQSQTGYTEVYAWGDDEFGQLGVSVNPTAKNYSTPRCCSFNIVIHQISCGEQHSAFIASNGYIYCMGNNDEGRLGLSQRDIKYSYSPCLVESLSRYRAVKVACGWGHTMALVESGEVFTWGYGADGQLGNNNPNSQFTPQLVDFSHLQETLATTKARDIASGGRHSFTIMENNKVCCFGYAEFGQLGTGASHNEIIPCVLDTIFEDVLEIACGYFHTLFLTESRKVYSTGNNSNGELGVGHKKGSFLPIKIMMLDSFQIEKIAASNHSAAITDKGELYLWGPFSFGENVFPQKIIIKNRIRNISLGTKFGVCIDSAGSLYGWGNNQNGELGLGDFEPRNNMNQIVTLQNKTIKDISCGGNFVIALGNTLPKKLEEPNENIPPSKTRPNLNLPLPNDAFPKNSSSINVNNPNLGSHPGLEFERKAKSQHNKANNPIGDFREKEETGMNFKKNPQFKYLSNEEIKNRQKASIYESPNRPSDREFEYVPGGNCETQRTASPQRSDINVSKPAPVNPFNRSNEGKAQKSKSMATNSGYQINILKNDQDFSSSKNPVSTNFRRDKISNDYCTLSKDLIKSRQYEFSSNKEYLLTTNVKESMNPEASVLKNASNADVNDYLIGSRDKSPQDNPKTEKIRTNSFSEIQHQQFELYQNNKREIENLKNDQITLEERYSKLEQNFFEVEQNLKLEKNKTSELNRLFEEARAQNRAYMKELGEREQFLEKIEFLNQALQEKEQEIIFLNGEIPKKERFFEESMKSMKEKYENELKSLEGDMEHYSQQLEGQNYEIQTANEELNRKNEMVRSLMAEKNDLSLKIEGNEDMRRGDLARIKKLTQDINALSEENSQLKSILEEKDNEIALMNRNLEEINEKLEYYESAKETEQRRIFESERELGSTQERAAYLEKLLTQKDNEIEQLKQMVDDFTAQKGTKKTEDRQIFEKRNYEIPTNNYEFNYGSVDFQKKERSITPNPSFKKSDRPDLGDSRGFEQTKTMNIERNIKKEAHQETTTTKIENKERSVINFNNTMINSVVLNSNLHEIKAKLSDLQKNKNALEKRMQDFEQRLKESRNNK